MIGVIIVNYASHRLIERSFGSWGHSPQVAVFVVDNFSTTPERRAVERMCRDHSWTCVPNTNGGYGHGANVGIAVAKSQGATAIIAANPDLYISAGQAIKLGSVALNNPGSIVAPLITDPSGRVWGQLGYVDVRHGRLRSPAHDGDNPVWVSGACLAASANTWDGLGGFATDYFMYWEDVDLCLRCQRSGGSVLLAEEIHVTHAVGGTQGQGRSTLYYYYNCRNRLVFASKHLRPIDQLRWLAAIPGDIRRVARRDSRLNRWRRLVRAVPPCTAGALAGAWRMGANASTGVASLARRRHRRAKRKVS